MKGSKVRARGAKELKKHLSGGKLTQRQAILATCYECCGGYADGKIDCFIQTCPLYPWMPYKETLKDPVLASGT
jgi:hypothetical protein